MTGCIDCMNQMNNELLWSFDDNNRFGYRKISAEAVASANFLDERTLPSSPHDIYYKAAAADIENNAPLASRRYIFHTAFCGSTLLCRTLTDQPRVMVLKEPDVLLQIARRQLDEGSKVARPYLAQAIGELSMPWVKDGVSVIKPTNSVNRILQDIQQVAPGKTLLMYSSLEDFILSCCKKLPQAETSIRWMAQYLIHQSDLGRKLGIDKSQNFNFLEACIVTWYAQMEYYYKAISVQASKDIALLGLERLLSDPEASVFAASDFLELDHSRAELSEKIGKTFSKNSKSVQSDFSARRREDEKAELKKHFASLLGLAEKWEDEVMRPIAVVPDFNGEHKLL
jgi:hypothetical protein